MPLRPSLLLIALLLVGSPAQAQPSPLTDLDSRAERRAVTILHYANVEAIDLAQRTLLRSKDARVIAYASVLLRDHRDMEARLQRVAKEEVMLVPDPDRAGIDDEADKLWQAHHASYRAWLERPTGPLRDRFYLAGEPYRQHLLRDTLAFYLGSIDDPEVGDLVRAAHRMADAHLDRAEATLVKLLQLP